MGNLRNMFCKVLIRRPHFSPVFWASFFHPLGIKMETRNTEDRESVNQRVQFKNSSRTFNVLVIVKLLFRIIAIMKQYKIQKSCMVEVVKSVNVFV